LKEEYNKWHSQYLNREFEMLVFGHSGYPVIVFPTSGGRYYEAKDRGLIESAKDLITAGKIKVFCPDSINVMSWYNNNIHPADRVRTHNAYENLILNDVIAFAKYDTGFERVAVCGCSFGGYHSANIAFRHPDKVSYLFSMGGAFDIKRFIFGYYDNNCYYNNPPDYLSNLNDEWYLKNLSQMGIILGTGENDFCLGENLRISDLLQNKWIPHWLDIRRGVGHDWNWWKEMFPQYLTKIES
jgi:esterase/lipase superfamily enzyme